jgi:hypothetical protein
MMDPEKVEKLLNQQQPAAPGITNQLWHVTIFGIFPDDTENQWVAVVWK